MSDKEADNDHEGHIKNNIQVDRVNLKTLQTEEDVEELELVSYRESTNVRTRFDDMIQE